MAWLVLLFHFLYLRRVRPFRGFHRSRRFGPFVFVFFVVFKGFVTFVYLVYFAVSVRFVVLVVYGIPMDMFRQFRNYRT